MVFCISEQKTQMQSILIIFCFDAENNRPGKVLNVTAKHLVDWLTFNNECWKHYDMIQKFNVCSKTDGNLIRLPHELNGKLTTKEQTN